VIYQNDVLLSGHVHHAADFWHGTGHLFDHFFIEPHLRTVHRCISGPQRQICLCGRSDLLLAEVLGLHSTLLGRSEMICITSYELHNIHKLELDMIVKEKKTKEDADHISSSSVDSSEIRGWWPCMG